MLNRKTVKIWIIACSGTIFQWYDFALFGLLSTYLIQNFFPHVETGESILLFASLAIGMVLAPLGSLILGHIGDRFGRRFALILSISLITVPTVMVGLTPSYTTVGHWSVFFLMLSRLVQGLTSSSEYSVSSIYLVESATNPHKCLAGSLSNSAYSIGFLVATCASLVISCYDNIAWLWRAPFLISAFGGIIVLFMRLKLPHYYHSNHFKKIDLAIVKQLKQPLLFVFIMAACAGVITYSMYVYIPSYLQTHAGLTTTTTTLLFMIAITSDILAEPFFASIADRVNNPKFIIRIGFILYCLVTPLFLLCINSKNMVVIGLGLLCQSIVIACTYSAMNCYLIMQFPYAYRCRAFSVAFNLGMSIFGGLTPLALSAISNLSYNNLWLVTVLIAFAVISFVSIYLLGKDIRPNTKIS